MILVAMGTRPEIIKLFPVIRELRRRRVPHRLLFTGQQMDLYEDVRKLVPPPDHTFGDMFSRRGRHNTLGGSFTKISQASEELFARSCFDTVVVQGDTTTAWAVAQMAFYNGIKVAHVEAGLRTFDLWNPYPEESNRTLISHVADVHFAPTRLARENLERIGVKHVKLVGNTVVDAVDIIRKKWHITTGKSATVMITLHRRENHPIMDQIFDEVDAVARENTGLEFLFPMHPNPDVLKHRKRLKAKNIRLTPPMGYIEMLRVLARVQFIISDSGGLQEEAAYFGKKILIVRSVTERPEILDIGLGRLVGRELRSHLDWVKTPPERRFRCPFGDGKAASRIVRVLSGTAGRVSRVS